ncbi:MAG TPA: hypothetical protein VFH53_03580 [Phycisphaerae bacterium]|nr:hypothetical protein [Phycisphaerae bacterium]
MSGFEIVSAAGPRRFTGSRTPDPGAPGRRGFDALCDVLLSPDDERIAEHAPPPAAPPGTIRGLYVLAMAGVEPAARRQTALAVAHELAPQSAPAAVFLFENGRADAHLLGEPACGRLGPQSYLASADMGENAAGIAGRCDQVGLAILDSVTAVPADLAPAVRCAVFVATPDAESLVETYRELKTWFAAPLAGRSASAGAALFVVGSDGGREVRCLHERFARAARRFLDCDVAIQGFLAGAGGAALPNEPLRLFADAPSACVWSALAAAAVEGMPFSPFPFNPQSAIRNPQSSSSAAVVGLWRPADREALLAAVEAQVPALLGERCRLVLRVDVDEPDAPPLAAVRDDGALVAILIADGRRPADARSAEHWLAVHRALLARAYPSAGIRADAAPSAVVLAPLEPAAADGVRRFLPVKVGGRQGIVILP